ncbi:MAG TPA: GAF domain-containing protein [Gaiellaceae bacterium]
MAASVDGEYLTRLQAVTDAALSHLELDELLAELLERIHSILEVDTCAILLLDEASDELVARAAVGLEEEVEQGVRIPVGGGFAGRIAAERRPILLPDVERAHVLNPILREKGIKTLLGVPLIVHDTMIGVLHVGTLVPREFEDHDIELLRLAGERAAMAIANASLFEAERKARRRLEHVQAVTDAALAHLELDELLAELLDRIHTILDVDTCAILLLDEASNELVARAAVGIEEEVEQGVRIPVGGGFAGRIAAERRPILLPDVDHAHVLNPILRQKGIKTLLGVPLIVRETVIGVLHVGTLVHHPFTPDEMELLELVAERVALAIERSRLHEETRWLDELKLNFVAVASHELRTPAAAVYGALATLRGRELEPKVRAALEETAWKESDRMRRLIEQLLDLSRLDARSVRVRPEPIVLRRLVEELIEEEGGSEVLVDVDWGLSVVVDPLVIERVVSNLLANARSHGRPPVRVSGEQRNRYLRLAVEDAGDGVPEPLRPRLFERFERGTAGEGTGIGLAIAKAYAVAHGGDLRLVPSERGARFELTLPLG